MKFEKQNIFFISDLHLGHSNIIKYDERPFIDIDEMNEKIIENWNNKVGEDDIVFNLGDVSFYSNELIYQLNGIQYLIKGNHDRVDGLRKMNHFEDIFDYKEIYVKDSDGYQDYQMMVLFHYPIYSWNKSGKGSWHLHGHCHQNLVGTDFGNEFYQRKVIDVGCNGYNYEPLSYSEVKEIMKQKITIKVD